MQQIEYYHYALVDFDFGQVHIVWWLSYCQVGGKISVEPCPISDMGLVFFVELHPTYIDTATKF